MNFIRTVQGTTTIFSIFLGTFAFASESQLARGQKAIESLTGCYLVDYNYTETEGLQPGYERDKRVYDANKNKSVKEWIYTDRISPERIRVQHILFVSDLSGTVIKESFLKHQVEDWEYNASARYDFISPLNWEVAKPEPGQWTRRITSLDDGLRYQCSSQWLETTEYPEWSCDNYAPIPGRETRDMGRKDYNTLQRSTRIVAYKNSWLERQSNTKTIFANGTKTPLAKEIGKAWYVRLPDNECIDAKEFAQTRNAFWSLLREVWDEVLIGDRPFIEKTIAGQPSRYQKIMELEDKYILQNLNNPATRQAAKNTIMQTIQAYRAN